MDPPPLEGRVSNNVIFNYNSKGRKIKLEAESASGKMRIQLLQV